MGTIFDPRYILVYFPKILARLHITLGIVVAATAIGLILGTLIATVRILRIPVASQAAALFISFQRGTPILVQLFVVYYGLPILVMFFLRININRWDKFFFVIAAYGLNVTAFFSETIRSSIASIPPAQWEAAYSVGMTGIQTFFRIIAPQAVKVAIPSLGVGIVVLLQDTSLAFSLGIIDVIGKIKSLGSTYYHTIEGYIGAAIIFVTLNFIFEAFFHRIGRSSVTVFKKEVPVK